MGMFCSSFLCLSGSSGPSGFGSKTWSWPGWSEVEPGGLWADIRAALTKVVGDSGLPAAGSSIRSIGICTMRSTFTTWDRRTGEEFHNFITWKDLRVDRLVRRWNRSLTLRVFRALMKAAHVITQND